MVLLWRVRKACAVKLRAVYEEGARGVDDRVEQLGKRWIWNLNAKLFLFIEVFFPTPHHTPKLVFNTLETG